MTVLTDRPGSEPQDRTPAAAGQLRLVVAGSVDDGKSTLVGRLLHDTKSILADQYDALEHVSRSRGADGFDLALLTDGLRAEREQGITIDVAYRYFATPYRSFVLADTPGHVQYTRNTVTGASTADAAVILVDVRNGVSAQTRRHAAVMALLRVPHVVFAVNKMDAVDWDDQRFADVETDVRQVARRVGLEHVEVLPVSALTGEGVAAPAPGPERLTLLSVLEQLPARRSLTQEALRFAVQLVLRPRTEDHPDYRGLAGRVGSGTVRVGDEVVAHPSGLRSVVVAVDGPRGPQPEATAGQSVTLRLADELDVARGEVLSLSGSDEPDVVRSLDGVLCWLSEDASRPRQRVLVKVGTRVVRGLLGTVEQRWHVEDQDWEDSGAPLELNDIGRLTLQLAEPVAVDGYLRHRHTGGYLVIDPDTGVTLAAGMAGGHLGEARTPA